MQNRVVHFHERYACIGRYATSDVIERKLGLALSVLLAVYVADCISRVVFAIFGQTPTRLTYMRYYRIKCDRMKPIKFLCLQQTAFNCNDATYLVPTAQLILYCCTA